MSEVSQTARRILTLEQQVEALRSGGGGGTSDGMEARVAVLEQIARDTRDALANIREDVRGVRTEITGLRSDNRGDFRWLLSLLAAGFLALLGLMAHGFHWY